MDNAFSRFKIIDNLLPNKKIALQLYEKSPF